MKAMIPMNDYGILADKNNTARVDSRFIAQFFEKTTKRYLGILERLCQLNRD